MYSDFPLKSFRIRCLDRLRNGLNKRLLWLPKTSPLHPLSSLNLAPAHDKLAITHSEYAGITWILTHYYLLSACLPCESTPISSEMLGANGCF
jgi:hypothetical protein